jgi:hypothetical protein
MKRLRLALVIYAALALLAWFTLTDQRIRVITIAILAMFAIRTLTYSKRYPRDEEQDLDEKK